MNKVSILRRTGGDTGAVYKNLMTLLVIDFLVLMKNAVLTQVSTLLVSWTNEPLPNLWRFVSEALRLCGVWCNPIYLLKERPEMGLPLLQALYTDNSMGQSVIRVSATKRIYQSALRSVGK